MSVRGHVLVVASRSTREVDGVIDRLRTRGCEVVRLSPCQYPEWETYSWKSGGRGAFDHVRAAWLCDFSGWSIEGELVGIEREVALAETTAFAEGLFLSMSASWLNRPEAVRSASRKLLQLATAERLGVTVPPTCITNDAQEARRFCGQNDRVVAKPLATGFIRYGPDLLKTYTRALDADADSIFNGLSRGPLIFQGRIDKVEEIRCIVVDGEAVLVRFDLRGLSPELVDIRTLDYARERARFTACIDRPDLAKASKSIVGALGLSYGCLDWAVDARGHAFFLECNPLGSFKWFEICGGADITGHISDALVRRCSNETG